MSNEPSLEKGFDHLFELMEDGYEFVACLRHVDNPNGKLITLFGPSDMDKSHKIKFINAFLMRVIKE